MEKIPYTYSAMQEKRRIDAEFAREQAYWEALKVDQIVFTTQGGYLDEDFFMHKITSIDVDGRKVEAIDYSQDMKRVTLRGFSTLEELANREYNRAVYDEAELRREIARMEAR